MRETSPLATLLFLVFVLAGAAFLSLDGPGLGSSAPPPERGLKSPTTVPALVRAEPFELPELDLVLPVEDNPRSRACTAGETSYYSWRLDLRFCYGGGWVMTLVESTVQDERPPAISLYHELGSNGQDAYMSILLPLNPDFRPPQCSQPQDVAIGANSVRLCVYDGAPSSLTQGRRGVVLSFDSDDLASGYISLYSETQLHDETAHLRSAINILYSMTSGRAP